MKRLRRGAVRDQSDSPFSAILSRLCDDSGALAAALVDAEGETVDYAGLLTPYEIKVAAAEWRIVLAVVHAARVPGFRHVTELTVRAGRRTFSMSAMPDGYAIALCLPRRSFVVSPRALAQAKRELAHEAGLVLPAGRSQATWARVQVRVPEEPRRQRRPDAVWVNGAWSPITILGRYQDRDLSRSERGYLAQLASGAEVFLVREPLGVWFVDNAAALSA
ncbi:MAG: hypothetical protein K0R38_636 [Polyangiaceae bacterium]|jgi:hypothetical protein|nr:hypothetical protein [Polyangiaceae bacterium]